MDDELSGFSVAPSRNCPHLADATFEVHSDLQPSTTGAAGKAPKKNLFQEYFACSACGDANETWVCVSCSYSGCSRYKNGHMVAHANDKSASHACVAISLFDLSCWCFHCDEYVIHRKLDTVFRAMHQGKFGFTPKVTLHTEVPRQTRMTLAVDDGEMKTSEDTDS